MAHGELMTKIRGGDAVVGVIGMGYVGLPLLLTFCRAGHRCLAYDIDARKVRKLNLGTSYIEHIPSAEVRRLRQVGQFEATDDPRSFRRCDALIICVPTPLTPAREPDMSFVEGTARTIAAHLRPDQLVVLESTTYPGTTREEVLPILERSGLKAGRDFFLAYSPEREDPGRKDFTTASIPKVVGGLNARSGRLACALYARAFARIVPVSSCEVAEASKILENVYRCINIALVNELKILFDHMGIDVWEVINAAATKPFGFQPFYPGPGLGGHCIPIDPFYLSWKARQYNQTTRFIELAGEINTAMPDYVIRKITEAFNREKKAVKGSRILVLGLAYKADVDDVRESPAIELIEKLQALGAHVDYNDPHVPRTHRMREHDLRMTSTPLAARKLATYDCVLIATAHSAYDPDWIVQHARLVIDTRNLTASVRRQRHKIVKA